jgi:cell division protein FtsB
MRRPTVSRPRPRLTSRAAVLAVVICAITLSLAYPVREYITQRRQISALGAQQQALSSQLSRLQAQQRQLNDPAYIEQIAQDQLHLCMPRQTCYVIIDGKPADGLIQPRKAAPNPWYDKLWKSVQQAGETQQAAKKTTR